MTDEPNTGDTSLPLPALERIETACLEFEAAWKRGEKPRIEDYLGGAPNPERNALFRELLLLDLDYRGRSSEQLAKAEYQAALAFTKANLAKAAARPASAPSFNSGYKPAQTTSMPSG